MKPLVFAAVLCFSACAAPAWAETFAAQGPFSGGVGPVVHAPTEEEARQLAIRECRQLSDTCANNPVSAMVGRYKLFVTTCCKTDGVRCHIVAVTQDEDAGRNEAYSVSLKAFVDAGFSVNNCWRHRTYSIRTGKRLRD